jgi:hypothetical protein
MDKPSIEQGIGPRFAIDLLGQAELLAVVLIGMRDHVALDNPPRDGDDDARHLAERKRPVMLAASHATSLAL